MFKPELWQSHDEYRTIISSDGRRLPVTTNIPLTNMMRNARNS